MAFWTNFALVKRFRDVFQGEADSLIGIERARRRLYYKAFLKIIELNSWLIIDHIPAAHKSTADQAFRLLTVSGEIFEGCKQSWSKNLTASVGDSGLASWFGMESSSRKISIANVSAVMAKCAAQFAVFRMVDLFLQAAKIVHEHNQNASLTDEDWLVNENSRPLFANGAMEDFHKLADVYERTT